MGSWIALSALQKTLFNAALISGSNYPNIPETILQKILLKFETLRLQERVIVNLHSIFGGFNSRFKDATTSNDWLSRDKLSGEQGQRSFCGFIVKPIMADVSGIESVFKKKNLELLNKSIPFLVFSGTHDPVRKMGKGAIRLNECLKFHGCKSELYLVEGARHEALNETNKLSTYNYILDFLEKTSRSVMDLENKVSLVTGRVKVSVQE